MCEGVCLWECHFAERGMAMGVAYNCKKVHKAVPTLQEPQLSVFDDEIYHGCQVVLLCVCECMNTWMHVCLWLQKLQIHACLCLANMFIINSYFSGWSNFSSPTLHLSPKVFAESFDGKDLLFKHTIRQYI